MSGGFGGPPSVDPFKAAGGAQRSDQDIELLRDELESRRRRALVKEIYEAQLRLVSMMYDKSLASTNLIMVAGYASFFGLWSITKSYLTTIQTLLSCATIAVSIAIFVLFEVAKIVAAGRGTRRRAIEITRTPSENLDDLLVNLRAAEADALREEQRLAKHWFPAVMIEVVFAVAGIATLFWGLLVGLQGEIRNADVRVKIHQIRCLGLSLEYGPPSKCIGPSADAGLLELRLLKKQNRALGRVLVQDPDNPSDTQFELSECKIADAENWSCSISAPDMFVSTYESRDGNYMHTFSGTSTGVRKTYIGTVTVARD